MATRIFLVLCFLGLIVFLDMSMHKNRTSRFIMYIYLELWRTITRKYYDAHPRYECNHSSIFLNLLTDLNKDSQPGNSFDLWISVFHHYNKLSCFTIQFWFILINNFIVFILGSSLYYIFGLVLKSIIHASWQTIKNYYKN